ncbi:hypothetical protein MODO_2629 [Myroides odoratimimus]|nr:hypothetical protein MODO_2629 [Myroides odoratimimus]
MVYIYFNTYMVQLKDEEGGLVTTDNIFQYLYGAVKRVMLTII